MDALDTKLAPRVRWWWLAAPLFVSAALRDLWAPDEPRYAMVARWCYEHDAFVILHRCGELYPDKPPFFYWLAGLLGWLSGWSVFAMRLVSIGATLATAAMVERIARRWLGELEALWAPVLFLGFALVAWHGARLQLDPTLMAACTGALVFASAPASDVRQASRQTLLAGLCVGIGALDKGPVAFVNAGLPILLWRTFRIRADGPRASRIAWIGAIALAVLPVLTWASIASYLEPALFKPLFFGQHLERAIEGTQHRGPPWQHLIEMPLYLLPWTVPVVLGIVDAWRAWRRKTPCSEGLLRAGLWFASLFLFFSITPAKRDLYLLPVYPACALLAAHALVSRWRASRLDFAMTSAVAVLALIGLFFAGGAVMSYAAPDTLERWTKFAHEGLGWRCAVIATPFLIGSVIALRAVRQWQLATAASTVAAAWACALVVLYSVAAPIANPLVADRKTAELLRSLPQRPTEIPFYGATADGPRFYGGGPCVPADNDDIEQRLAAQGDQFLAVVGANNWRRMSDERKRLFAVLAESSVGNERFVVLGRAR